VPLGPGRTVATAAANDTHFGSDGLWLPPLRNTQHKYVAWTRDQTFAQIKQQRQISSNDSLSPLVFLRPGEPTSHDRRTKLNKGYSILFLIFLFICSIQHIPSASAEFSSLHCYCKPASVLQASQRTWPYMLIMHMPSSQTLVRYWHHTGTICRNGGIVYKHA
jgi:hypothetical protein